MKTLIKNIKKVLGGSVSRKGPLSFLPIKNAGTRKKIKRGLYLLGALFVAGIIALALFVLLIFFGFFGDLPEKEELVGIQNPVASEVYSQDGVLLGKYYKVNRTLVKHKDINPVLFDALVATEDARFFQHGGIDAKSLMRVIVKTILMSDESAGGGSTLSQQLVKNLYPRQRHRFRLTMPVNKIKEMIVAGRLENLYEKDDILALYLNTVPFGEDVYGIVTASERYFSTTPKDIKPQEAAMLIGMLKAPTSYSPRLEPEKALSRRNTVIEQMEKYGKLTSLESKKLKKTPLGLKYNFISTSDGLAPYFRDFIKKELLTWCKANDHNLFTDGLKIYTTINSDMQRYAEEAVTAHMTKLQDDFFKHWGKQKPWGRNTALIDRGMKNSRRYKKMKEQGHSDIKIKAAFLKKIDMKVFTYKGMVEKKMSPKDSIAYYLMFLNTGFVVTDPNEGRVKAYVGGVNHKYFKYDHAQTKRQVGSTFKPIVYATALDRGDYPCSYLPNKLITYPEYQDWTPKNSDEKYGGSYSMAGGIKGSVNVVSVQTIMKTGPYYVVEMAKKLGIDSEIPEMPSIALGTPDISVMEMTEAYGVFPNKGIHIPLTYLLKIKNKKGHTLHTFEPKLFEKKQVLHPEDAMIMTEMMQTVVDSGTARRLRWRYNLQNDIAGKTGTTQNQTDGWFMGYTPKFVGGVWVGGADRTVRFNSIQLGQGANMALPIFGEFLARLAKDPKYTSMVNTPFPEPNDYVQQLLNCPSWVPFETTGVPLVAEEVADVEPVVPSKGLPTLFPSKPKVSVGTPKKSPVSRPKITKPRTKVSAKPKSKTTKKKKKKKKSLKERLFGRKK